MNVRTAIRPARALEFDVELTPEIRLNHMCLRRNSRRQWRVYPASLRGNNVANIAPALAERITAAALAAVGGQAPDDITGD